MKHLLIVSNCPAESARQIQQAVANGAADPEISGIQVVVKEPLDAGIDDVMLADGFLLGSTENFGYMSGLMKDFFERIYYAVLEEKQGLPYGLFIKAGQDGEGAINSIQRIISGLRWQEIHPPITCVGKLDAEFLGQCHELGMTLAAGLEAEIY